MEHIVLVGGGLASTYAAAQLRSSGFVGRVTMLSEEAEHPYDHVPLSKDYLHGGGGYHELYLRDADFYRDHHIDLRLNTRVTGLDPEARTVQLGNGETMPYSSVLLATGATPRQLPLPGTTASETLDGVHSLRTLDDARRLRQDLQQSQRVAVIGAGFLGCEVAASAAMLGRDVTLISHDSLPMLSVLGAEMATVYRDLHAEQGVQILANAEAAELRGTARVEQVLLADGRAIQVDTVVIAIGATPRTALAEQACLEVNNGIITDASLATSAPGVYAVGDVAAVWNPTAGKHERREHFDSARTQGKAAARSMLGEHVRYDALPFFFSDQYGVWMEFTGTAGADAELVVHGDVASRQFVAFWLRDGQLQAAMNMGLQGVPRAVRPLIRSGEAVSDQRMRDIVDQAQSVAGP